MTTSRLIFQVATIGVGAVVLATTGSTDMASMAMAVTEGVGNVAVGMTAVMVDEKINKGTFDENGASPLLDFYLFI
jgi:hypothetical protein